MPPLLKYTTCECTAKSLSKILMLNCFVLFGLLSAFFINQSSSKLRRRHDLSALFNYYRFPHLLLRGVVVVSCLLTVMYALIYYIIMPRKPTSLLG